MSSNRLCEVLMKLLLLTALLLGSLVSAAETTVVLNKSNTIVMNTVFDNDSVAKVAQTALELNYSLPPGQPINLVINSPGGSIFSGIELIQNLNSLGRKVNTISLFSASMAFQTVQGLNGTRYLTKNGTLMSHKAKGGFEGEFPGQLDSRYQYVLGVVTDLNKVAVARTGGKQSLPSYDALIENEYWCSGQRCVDAGFADAVANIRCDKSMSGSHEETMSLGSFLGMNLTVDVIMSDCPTITGPLAVKVKVDGKAFSSVVHKLTRDQKEKINELRKVLNDKLLGKDRQVVKYTELK